MIRAVLSGVCVIGALAACDNSELGRSLGVVPTVPMEEVAQALPDYAIDAFATRSMARFIAENCSSLSFGTPTDVSQQYDLYARLHQDGFTKELFDALPDEVRDEIDDRVTAHIRQKYLQMGMTARGQSCTMGRRQIAEDTALGSLLFEDRGTS